MQVKKQQLELDIKQQTGSKLRKEYIKAVYCYPAYLTYMQSSVQFSSVQSLSRVRLFVTPWTATLQEAGQVIWYFHLLKNFPQFVVIHTSKALV